MKYKNNVDKQYNNLFQKIIDEGQWYEIDSPETRTHGNRTGVRAKTIFAEQIKMDCREGFPIFTTRKSPFECFAGELECFIQGFTSKKEFEKRGCRWWSSWANPQKVPYNNDPETLKLMQEEDDLGLIYGSQLRDFKDPNLTEEGMGIDQLNYIVENIKNQIDNRRLISSYWNPLALDHQGLPPCHYSFQVHLSPCGSYLDLMWQQRSVDLALGANNVLYGILIHLLAHTCGRIPRYLTASYGNVHIYENQIEQVKEQIQRPTHKLPTLKLKEWKFDNILDWDHTCIELVGYQHSGILKFPKATV